MSKRRIHVLGQELAHINVQRVLAVMTGNDNGKRYWDTRRKEVLRALEQEFVKEGWKLPVYEQRDLFEDVPFDVAFPDE